MDDSNQSETAKTPSRLENGRFCSAEPVGPTTRCALFKFMCSERNNSNIPKTEAELSKTLPVLTPDPQQLSHPPDEALQVTWLGHACVLVQFEGVSFLTDPVFSERCSPLSFMGPKRYRPPPLTVSKLPNIDAVFISHNHYDHLDVKTVKEFNQRFGTGLKWFVPQRLKSWMTDTGIPESCVTEMEWWEEAPLKEGVKVVFTPAQHWSRRGLTDFSKTLWGSWCVLGQRKRFYFAGDTAYAHVFKQIGHHYGPFDLAAIPIGAYEPRWFMKSMHNDPGEAVQIHVDLRARRSIGIHWGTFPLSYEPYMDPPIKVTEALEKLNLDLQSFFTVNHGETKLIDS